MKRGLLAGAVCVALAGGAIMVASSTAGDGKAGSYRFASGVVVTDQNAVVRVSVANLSNTDRNVKVTFLDASATPVEKETIEVPGGGQENSVSNTCPFSSCPTRVEVRSRSALVAPTLRYQDTDGGVQQALPGDFVVTRDGKRIW